MGSAVDPSGLLAALRQVGSLVVFAVLPVLVAGTVFATSWSGSNFLYDFHGDLYNAGTAILHGHNPYRAAYIARLAAQARAGGHPTTALAVPVYPAPALLLTTPLAWLSLHAAGALFSALGLAALGGGLWLLGVRDWRCYGVALLSWPVVHSLRLGQVNELLVLGTAIAWRLRDRKWPPALALAAVVALKLLLWPLGVWLAITGRWRTLALSAVAVVAVGFTAWAIIGFDGLGTYRTMLGDLSTVAGGAGVSLASLARAIDVPREAMELIGWVAAGALFLLARGRDRETFSAAVVAALLVSPLVWPHYLTLLFVPIALTTPRLSALWLLPLLAYLAPVEATDGNGWQIGLYLAIELAVAGWAVVGAGARRSRPAAQA